MRAALEAWRVQHPQATFDEIEDEVYRHLAALHAQWLGEVAPPRHVPAAEAAPDAPPARDRGEPRRGGECGVALRPSGVRRRQVVTRMGATMGATTTLTRRYWVCPAWGAGYFPLSHPDRARALLLMSLSAP